MSARDQVVDVDSLEKNGLGGFYRVLQLSNFGGRFQLLGKLSEPSRAALPNADTFHVQPKALGEAGIAVVARNTEITIKGHNADGSLEAMIPRAAVVPPFTPVTGHFLVNSSHITGIYEIEAEDGAVYSSETHNIYVDAFRDLCEHGAKKLENISYSRNIMDRLQQPDMCKTPPQRKALVADLSSALTTKEKTDTFLATIMARYA